VSFSEIFLAWTTSNAFWRSEGPNKKFQPKWVTVFWRKFWGEKCGRSHVIFGWRDRHLKKLKGIDRFLFVKETRQKYESLEHLIDFLEQLCPACALHAAQSKVLCGLVKVLATVEVSCILTTSPYFIDRELDIFDAGSPHGHFITSVTIAVRIPTLSVH